MPNAEGTKIAEKAKERRENLKKGADAATKAAKNAIEGKDPFSQEDVQAAILAQLPPEVQQMVADAKSVQEAFDRVFPKGKDGERDFSTAGGIRTALDLLDKYGGEDVKKVLEARQKALDMAAKLGINIPSIEDLVDFDWDKLSEKLKDLKFEDVVNLNNLISNIEGKLLEFLPPGMDKSIQALRDMLKEFGLPSSLSEAYDELKKEVDTPPTPPTPSAFPPGVFVNKHRMARMGLTFMAHGAVPLTGGPGATTVSIENMPVWRSKIDFHTCPVPFAAPPAPDGPGMCSGGFNKVFVEGSFACQHDIEGIDTPLCGKTNLFLTQGQAISAWNKLKSQGGKLENQDTEKAAAGGGKNKGGSGGGEGTETEGPPEKKEEPKGVTAVIHWESTAMSSENPIVPGNVIKLRCDSYDHQTDMSGAATPDAIKSRKWHISPHPGWATLSDASSREVTLRIDGDANCEPVTVFLSVVDAQSEADSTSVLLSSKDTLPASTLGVDPIAIFQLFDQDGVKVGGEGSYDPLRIGKIYQLRSVSYDPDDGDGSVPNEGISRFQWRLSPSATILSPETSESSILFSVDSKPGWSAKDLKVTIELTVWDNDSPVNSHFAYKTLEVVGANRCGDPEAVRLHRARLLMIADELSGGFPVTASCLKAWYNGTGSPGFSESWMRSYRRVRVVEEEIALETLAKGFREASNWQNGVSHTRRYAQRSPVEPPLGASLDDLYGSWGPFNLEGTLDCQVSRDDSTIELVGVLKFVAMDRYNWNPGSGIPIPDLSLWIANASGLIDADLTYWGDNEALFLEDCYGCRPFDLRCAWSRSVSLTLSLKDATGSRLLDTLDDYTSSLFG